MGASDPAVGEVGLAEVPQEVPHPHLHVVVGSAGTAAVVPPDPPPATRSSSGAPLEQAPARLEAVDPV